MDAQRWRERAGSFGAGAEVYERSRPSYPVESVRWLLPDGARRVLDLGAGTGRLAAVLLDLGLEVVAVEPSDEMRSYVPPAVQALPGTAEAVPLPDASVDAVLVGQAFHWFDVGPALAEMARVLRPGGTVGLLWNVRDERVPWVREVWRLIDAEGVELSYPFAAQAGLTEPELRTFAYEQQLDADRLVELVASRSMLLTLPAAEQDALLEQVPALAPPGLFMLPYRTEAWRSVLGSGSRATD